MTRNKLFSLVKIVEEMKNYWNFFRKLILLLFLVSQMVGIKEWWAKDILSAPYRELLREFTATYRPCHTIIWPFLGKIILPSILFLNFFGWIPIFYILCGGTEERRSRDWPYDTPCSENKQSQSSTWYVYIFNTVLLIHSVHICVWIHQNLKDE